MACFAVVPACIVNTHSADLAKSCACIPFCNRPAPRLWNSYAVSLPASISTPSHRYISSGSQTGKTPSEPLDSLNNVCHRRPSSS